MPITTTDADWEELKAAAKVAAGASYAPYSRFSVGAAVRTRSGQVHMGANVENASYGLSICAERVAIAAAVQQARAEGDVARLITSVVACDAHGEVLAPCGACRQVIMEFGAKADVLLPSGPASISSSLKSAFGPGSLPDRKRGKQKAPDDKRADLVYRLFRLDPQQRVALMNWLLDLRQLATKAYPDEVHLERTRAALFVRTTLGLEIAPGYFSNFERASERVLCIPEHLGITGRAYAVGETNYGKPCEPGALAGAALPQSEQDKVDPGLEWVVAWPIGRFGVVSLDGFDNISQRRMGDLSKNPDLLRTVEGIAHLTKSLVP